MLVTAVSLLLLLLGALLLHQRRCRRFTSTSSSSSAQARYSAALLGGSDFSSSSEARRRTVVLVSTKAGAALETIHFAHHLADTLLRCAPGGDGGGEWRVTCNAWHDVTGEALYRPDEWFRKTVVAAPSLHFVMVGCLAAAAATSDESRERNCDAYDSAIEFLTSRNNKLHRHRVTWVGFPPAALHQTPSSSSSSDDELRFRYVSDDVIESTTRDLARRLGCGGKVSDAEMSELCRLARQAFIKSTSKEKNWNC